MLTKQKQVLRERLESGGGWRWEMRPSLSKEVTCAYGSLNREDGAAV